MALKSEPEMGINSWLEDELYQQYLRDRSTVDESWKHIFEKANGARPTPAPRAPAAPDARRPRRSSPANNSSPCAARPARIAENMARQRRHSAGHFAAHHRRQGDGREPPHHQPAPHPASASSKVSYTHLIGWAIVKALEEIPGAQPRLRRTRRPAVPRGAAADQPRASPSMSPARTAPAACMVPNIKNAGALNFQEYLTAFDDLVARARTGKLTPADFQGTTISLTNPGHRRHHGFQPAPDAGPGRHHRRRRHRLSRPNISGAAAETRAVAGHQQGDDA